MQWVYKQILTSTNKYQIESHSYISIGSHILGGGTGSYGAQYKK